MIDITKPVLLGAKAEAPFNLYSATIWTSKVQRTSFVRSLAKGQVLNNSGRYTLYTESVRDQISEKGYAVRKVKGMWSVVCHEVTEEIEEVFESLVTEYVDKVNSTYKKEILKSLRKV
jgi:hypothetical protein